jgi:hypothetical protein
MAKLARFSALHQPAKKVTKRRVVVVVVPPGGGGDIVGTMTVGQSGGNYGYGSVNPIIGSMTQDPASIVQSLSYSEFGGGLVFNNGTYTGPNGSITVGYGTLNGSGSVSLTLDGITRTINFDGMSWSDSGADYFGLATKVGQTLNFSITIL